ncbi:MAG: ferredoxin [Mycobacterium sp.]|jgi:ferredoxin|nr:ferredoxin [Mycobacterium sp.]MDT5283493.1 ferredoxin [Mycobacterium sp.]
MRIKLDRTVCDGFGACAKHAPEYFSLDDWGYASLVGNGEIPNEDHDAVTRALLDCPVHAIIEMGGQRAATPTAPNAEEAPEPHVKSDDNEAIWGFVR